MNIVEISIKIMQRRAMHRHDGRNPEIMDLERNLRVKRYWDENWKEKLSGHGVIKYLMAVMEDL